MEGKKADRSDRKKAGRPEIFWLYWMQEEAKLGSVFKPGRIFARCRPIL